MVDSSGPEFARAVREACKQAMKGQRVLEAPADVQRLAYGLALLQQLLNKHLDEAKQTPRKRDDPLAWIGTGALEAFDLLEALMEGGDHPVHRLSAAQPSIADRLLCGSNSSAPVLWGG